MMWNTLSHVILCFCPQRLYRALEDWCWRPSCCALFLSWCRWWAWSAQPAWKNNQSRKTKWHWLEGLSSLSLVRDHSVHNTWKWICRPHEAETEMTKSSWMFQCVYCHNIKSFSSSCFSRCVSPGRSILVCQQNSTGLLQPLHAY